ncbi:MAG: VOC family protein [Actinomycetota bacterium]|nr:VOC family protein [Actinomycetota bacterium]
MIGHVALEVREDDVEASVLFWALLGFAHVEAPAALADRSTWVQAGSTQIHLLHVREPVVAPEGHVAVVVGDYEAVLESLREAGFEPRPRRRYWGSPRAFVRCPAGHRVEVMDFVPA